MSRAPDPASLVRRAAPALVPALVLVGVVQAVAQPRLAAYAEVGWVLLVCLPLAARRRYPATSSVVVSLGLVAYTMATGAPTPFAAAVLAFLVGFYSVGAWARRRPAVVALVVGLASFWSQDARLHHAPGEYVASAMLVAGPWVAGRALRAVRRQNARLRELTTALEREREAHARDAVMGERARLARELHDVVGHSLSVISLHTQAAESALEHDPTRLHEPLSAIRTATRTAMVEMRRLVTVLDAADDPRAAGPQPLLTDLPALVDEHRSSGLDVRLLLDEPPREIPPGVQLAAYRIVQEGLTNVRRHTVAPRASVTVRFDPVAARVEVSDTGPAAAGVSADLTGGRGLAGVRARADSCGGSVEAGPAGAGWVLRALLPYDAAPAT